MDSVTPTVQKFLARLKDIASDYITELSRSSRPRGVHYEDLFSLSEQAFRSESDHIPNLAVVEFRRRLRTETQPLYADFQGGSSGGVGFTGLAETACDFLHWVVHHKLRPDGTPRAGLQVISDAAKHVDELDIFTLNHDLLVEDQLRETGFGLDYEDGFADRRGDVRAFSFWPERNRKKVRLFKLHGSINWYFYNFPGWAYQCAIPDKDPSHSRDQNGQRLIPAEAKAAFLSGTVVKELRYGTELFGEIFYQFRRHLDRHKHLVFCGYGFGDTGINNRIHQWLCDSLDGSNKLIVLHEGSEQDFFEDKPLWMQEMKSERRLALVDKWLENCKLADIERYFDDVD